MLFDLFGEVYIYEDKIKKFLDNIEKSYNGQYRGVLPEIVVYWCENNPDKIPHFLQNRFYKNGKLKRFYVLPEFNSNPYSIKNLLN